MAAILFRPQCVDKGGPWRFIITGRYCKCHDTGSLMEDEGDLEDIHRFPIKALAFGDTEDSGEYMYYTLGPLKCIMGRSRLNIFSHFNNLFSAIEF